jgi:hypothetical protein
MGSLGLAFSPWARIFSAGSNWLLNFLEPAILGGELFLLEPFELGLQLFNLGRLGPLVQGLVQTRALDRGAGRERVDLTVGTLVVGIELLDLFPAGDGLLPVLVFFMNVRGMPEELRILGLGRHRLHVPLG